MHSHLKANKLLFPRNHQTSTTANKSCHTKRIILVFISLIVQDFVVRITLFTCHPLGALGRSALVMLKLITKLPVGEVVNTLQEEVDSNPTLLECLFTLNIAYWHGKSPVCGKIWNDGFELRNRRGPSFSPELVGRLSPLDDSTVITIFVYKPILAKIYKWTRFQNDEEVILRFLVKTLNAEQVGDG